MLINNVVNRNLLAYLSLITIRRYYVRGERTTDQYR